MVWIANAEIRQVRLPGRTLGAMDTNDTLLEPPFISEYSSSLVIMYLCEIALKLYAFVYNITTQALNHKRVL